MIHNRDGNESCSICGDDGYVLLSGMRADGYERGAAPCQWCQVGAMHATHHPRLNTSYAVDELVCVAHTNSPRISLQEYAASETGKNDPNLAKARDLVMRMRKAKRSQHRVER